MSYYIKLQDWYVERPTFCGGRGVPVYPATYNFYDKYLRRFAELKNKNLGGRNTRKIAKFATS